MAVWRQTVQSQSGNFLILQPRPHFEGCFAAAKIPLGTQVPLRSAVRPFRGCKMGCEILILLPNDFQTSKWIQNDLQASKWLRKCSRHQNGLWNSHTFRSPIATPCEILHLLWKWPFDCKMIFQTSKWLWNDFQTSKWAAKKCFSFFLLASKWLRNGLQVMKWFVKTPYKAKGSCKNANRASQPCI